MPDMKNFLDSATSIFERRFLKNAFLPVFLLPIAIAAPWALQGSRLDNLVSHWERQGLAAKTLDVVLYIGITWFVAAIVASQWRSIIRLFEGYPLQKANWLSERCVAWHQSKYDELQKRQNGWAIYYGYPERPFVLPTRLGNVIRAAEQYPFYRFRADTVTLWPRIYHLMPREHFDDVESARATLEFLLVMSLWFAVAGTGALILLTFTHASFPLMLLILVLAAAGFYGFYLSAIEAAREYGEQLRSAMELYRLQLLERLKLPSPSNLAEEREIWLALGRFMGSNQVNLSAPYVDPDPPHLVVELSDLPQAGSRHRSKNP